MDWRTYSNGRRNRRNNRLDNRNRWIVAEEGQRSAKNTAIGHGLVQGFPLSGGIPEVKKIDILPPPAFMRGGQILVVVATPEV